MRIIWTDEEKEYVRANAGVLTDQQMADNLTRITGRHVPMSGARRQRQKMGLKKKHGRGVCQLDESVRTLRAARGKQV